MPSTRGRPSSSVATRPTGSRTERSASSGARPRRSRSSSCSRRAPRTLRIPAARHQGTVAGLAIEEPPPWWDAARRLAVGAFVAGAERRAARRLARGAAACGRDPSRRRPGAPRARFRARRPPGRHRGLSDNGYSFGEHRWEGKTCPYEACVRVPLAVSLGLSRGQREELVSMVDLARPILHLAGVGALATMDGTSLRADDRGGEVRRPDRRGVPGVGGDEYPQVGRRPHLRLRADPVRGRLRGALRPERQAMVRRPLGDTNWATDPRAAGLLRRPACPPRSRPGPRPDWPDATRADHPTCAPRTCSPAPTDIRGTRRCPDVDPRVAVLALRRSGARRTPRAGWRRERRPVPSPDPEQSSPIEHVIFLVKENRSFDHYFGKYPGAEERRKEARSRTVTRRHSWMALSSTSRRRRSSSRTTSATRSLPACTRSTAAR